MNVTKAFSDIVTQWNTDNKCGCCWEYAGRLRESDLNEYQKRSEDCCILVAITDYTWSYITVFDRTTGFNTTEAKEWRFNLHVLASDDIGLNMYNEIAGHDLSESKYETILQPLEDCMITPVDFCEATGNKIEVVSWGSARERIDWLDMNYTGYTIPVQLRLNNL